MEDLGVIAFGNCQFAESYKGNKVNSKRYQIDHYPAGLWARDNHELLDPVENPVKGKIPDHKISNQKVKLDLIRRKQHNMAQRISSVKKVKHFRELDRVRITYIRYRDYE